MLRVLSLIFSNCKDRDWKRHDDKVVIQISGPCELPFSTSNLPFRSVSQGIIIWYKISAVNHGNKEQFWWLGTFIVNYVLNCHFPICGYHCGRDSIQLVTCSKFRTHCASVLLIVVWNCILWHNSWCWRIWEFLALECDVSKTSRVTRNQPSHLLSTRKGWMDGWISSGLGFRVCSLASPHPVLHPHYWASWKFMKYLPLTLRTRQMLSFIFTFT
jgi:hypothetical protein